MLHLTITGTPQYSSFKYFLKCIFNIYRQDIIEYILPSNITILKDSTTDVKVSWLENISKLALSLGEENFSLYIIPEIEKTSLN
jgi:hypothetical protein